MAALKTNIFKSFKEANKFAARHQGDGVELEVSESLILKEGYTSRNCSKLVSVITVLPNPTMLF